MSTKATQTEDLTKSIDALLDEVFSDDVSKGSPLDLAADSKTTADAAIASAPAMQKDESRGAGRPKQISDVPQNDMDGRRDSDYDAAIAAAKKEEEPEETNQSPSIDQTSGKGHIAAGATAPKMAPFKKSEAFASEDEYNQFLEFKKSKAEAADKAAKVEELKKAQAARKDQEDLVKSAVREATSQLIRENEQLRKSMNETQSLIKAMASQPVRSKSITGIEALEKSENPASKTDEPFPKSEILDAAFELAKSGKIRGEVVSEIEMTNRCSDPEARLKIEKFLEGKK